ncbi:MAG: FecR family protein [Thiomicrorhabdus sp.]|nr:FecR family protein [Thiomicrorhabdus sp.]
MYVNQKPELNSLKFALQQKINPISPMIHSFVRWFILCVSLFFISIMASFVYAATPVEKDSTQTAIGHIQFVIGQQVYIKRQNQQMAASIGLSLYENDSLITGKNSFIHVKMADDALISIRPQSHLKIDCYQGKAEQGEPCLKFTLLKGQVRKVSGKAGKANPTQYRLNTPVAAIGIRGTDYIASVQNGTSLVQVMQGAISVSPFIEGCTAQGFGECHTSFTALLTEYDTYMLRILSEQMPQPVTASLQVYSPQVQASEVSVENEPAEEQESSEGEHRVEGNTEDNVTENITEENPAEPQALPRNLMQAEMPVLKDNDDLIAQFIQQANIRMEERLIEDGLPILQPMPVIKQTADLVFGTWSPYADGIALPYEQAKQGRNITVGGREGALWRTEGTYRPPAGRINYSLAGSHAYVMSGGQVTSAEVTSGSMNIDFDQKVLFTQMTIEPTNMRKVVYTASHNLTRPDGIFANNNAAGRIGEGAISNDGSQVGYRLQTPVERGVLHADTLWDANNPP